MLPLLPSFSRQYPKIEVDLHLDDNVSDMIAEGFDVGIRAGHMNVGNVVVREIAPLHSLARVPVEVVAYVDQEHRAPGTA